MFVLEKNIWVNKYTVITNEWLMEPLMLTCHMNKLHTVSLSQILDTHIDTAAVIAETSYICLSD